jgi:hypothetical protein
MRPGRCASISTPEIPETLKSREEFGGVLTTAVTLVAVPLMPNPYLSARIDSKVPDTDGGGG